MKKLEQQIPKDVIRDYLLTRKMNLKVNLMSLDLVKEGIIDFPHIITK